jgi:hypothetical protein
MDPLYCVIISLALWLETFIGDSPTAALTPYVLGFSDDIQVPSGGKKPKTPSKTSLAKRSSNERNSRIIKDPLVVTASENTHLLMSVGLASTKTKRTLGEGGSEKGVCRTFMMMRNFHT